MLTLYLSEETEKDVVYHYYPEGKDSYGKIVVDKEKGVMQTESSENDKFGHYLAHAVKRIKEYFEDENYKKDDMVAWY